MNTIREAIDAGATTHLGPVLIKRDFGMSDKTKKPLRTLIVSDATGEVMLKLWDNSSHAKVEKGDTVTVHASGDNGSIAYTRFLKKDNTSEDQLNCNGVVLSVVSQNKAVASAKGRAATSVIRAAAAREDIASMQELIDYGMKCVLYAMRKAAATDPPIPFDGSLANSVFGSAMYGFKEGRHLSKRPPAPAPPPPEPEPEPEPEPAPQPENLDDMDEIPF